ncbi:hypothetical protein D3C75_1342010 [compost metagenome]
MAMLKAIMNSTGSGNRPMISETISKAVRTPLNHSSLGRRASGNCETLISL